MKTNPLKRKARRNLRRERRAIIRVGAGPARFTKAERWWFAHRPPRPPQESRP